MKKGLAFLFGWCLIIVCVVASIQTWALSSRFYIQKYEQIDLAQQLDVTSEDLNKSITVLLDYLEDKREDINETIEKNGKKQEAFDQREKLHMVDVKNLYQNVLKVSYLCIGLMIVLIFYFFRKKQIVAYLTQGYIRASLCFLTFVTLLGIWIVTDFTDFWIHFHHVFFPQNDYWLLTPGKDFMIDMLPEEVFETLVIRIVITVVLILGSLLLYSVWYQRKKAPIAFEEEE